MIKSIKLYQARALINQNKGKFVYVNQDDNDPYVEVIFKGKGILNYIHFGIIKVIFLR